MKLSDFITPQTLEKLQAFQQEFLPKVQQILDNSAPFIHKIVDNIIASRPYMKFLILNCNVFCLSDGEFLEALKELENETNEAVIMRFTITFYTKNNWEETKRLLKEWEEHYEFIHIRIPILKSCLNIITISAIEDFATVVIPCLIAQLEGILRDFYVFLDPKEPREKATPKKLGEHPLVSNLPLSEGRGLMSAIINVFQDDKDIKAKTEKELLEYNMYRHKIQHGEPSFLNYGTVETLIRLILFLDSSIKTIALCRNNLNKV